MVNVFLIIIARHAMKENLVSDTWCNEFGTVCKVIESFVTLVWVKVIDKDE